MEPYIYQDLPNADSIRLLFVEPLVDANEDISGSLRTFPMGQDTKYCALSYSWAMEDGDASIAERIIIDGRYLGVTRNLSDALRRIFAGGKRRMPIWVDAVCIHQSDSTERNDQVARMGNVYYRAAEVICWLGDCFSSVESYNIASMIACFNNPRHAHFREHEIAMPNGSFLHMCIAHAASSATKALIRTDPGCLCLPTHIIDCFEGSQLTAVMTEIHQTLEALFNKRYWGRRWIVQELCWGREQTYVYWADRKVDARRIQDIFEPAYLLTSYFVVQFFGIERPGGNPAVHRAFARAKRLHDVRSRISTANQIINMLAFSIGQCQGLECTDPRDRVYSLLSLDPETNVQADYSMTTGQVYTAFAIDTIIRTQCLPSLLWWAAFTRPVNSYRDAIEASLPSWVPDLRNDTYFVERGTTLGHWDVNEEGQLTCSALIIGSMSSDLSAVLRVAPAELSDGYPVRIDYPWFNQARCCPGDLVCIFESMTNWFKYSWTRRATVLQPYDNGGNVYRIVTILELEAPGPESNDEHPVRTIHIR